MINIHTELMKLVTKQVISAEDFYLLLCITKRIKATKQAYPSIALLQEETGFGRDKVYKCLSSLEKAGLLVRSQRHQNGRLSSNLYTIKTKLLGVYISVDNEEIEIEDIKILSTENQGTERKQLPENQYSENQYPENPTISINQSSLSINQSIEVKKINKKNSLDKSQKQEKFNAEDYVKTIYQKPEVVQAYLGWIEVRKIKKYPTTKTIMDLHKKRIEECTSVEEAIKLLEMATEKSWQGLDIEWLRNNKNSRNSGKITSSDIYISNSKDRQ